MSRERVLCYSCRRDSAAGLANPVRASRRPERPPAERKTTKVRVVPGAALLRRAGAARAARPRRPAFSPRLRVADGLALPLVLRPRPHRGDRCRLCCSGFPPDHGPRDARADRHRSDRVRGRTSSPTVACCPRSRPKFLDRVTYGHSPAHRVVTGSSGAVLRVLTSWPGRYSLNCRWSGSKSAIAEGHVRCRRRVFSPGAGEGRLAT